MRSSRHPRSPRRASRSRLLASSVFVLAGVAALIWGSSALQGTPGSSASPSVAQATRVRGSASAPITVEEYADFQCPACALFTRTAATELLATYVAASQVKIVFHHFAFLGLESSWAAEAAECAGEQGKFWDFHDRLYASQAGENRGAFSRENLKRMGDALGLAPSFATCVDSGRYAQVVRESTRAGQDRGVRATPTLFIGAQKIEGSPSFDELRAIIEPLLPRS